MTVDFEFGRAPAMRVASIAWKGPWSEARVRQKFETIERWAKAHKVATGRWIARWPGDNRYEVAIEVKGPARGDGTIRLRSVRATRVARVIFDPDVVSPRVVYHGLSDWCKWRRRDKKIRAVTGTRELYPGNPWRDPKAWARTEVQYLVR